MARASTIAVNDGEARGVEKLDGNLNSLSATESICPQVCALHYGNARSPIVRVVPDLWWPGMYRVTWPDSQQSDMANLSRAKDAAAAICERGPPRLNQRLLHWEIDRRERPAKAPPVHLQRASATPTSGDAVTGSIRRRNKIAGQFSARTIEMMVSIAFRVLSHFARRVLDRLEMEHAHHGGQDNGALPVTFNCNALRLVAPSSALTGSSS
jgi:hypothetical protein